MFAQMHHSEQSDIWITMWRQQYGCLCCHGCKNMAELLLKRVQWCLLGPAIADQSDQTGIFSGGGGLKEIGTKMERSVRGWIEVLQQPEPENEHNMGSFKISFLRHSRINFPLSHWLMVLIDWIDWCPQLRFVNVSVLTKPLTPASLLRVKDHPAWTQFAWWITAFTARFGSAPLRHPRISRCYLRDTSKAAHFLTSTQLEALTNTTLALRI